MDAVQIQEIHMYIHKIIYVSDMPLFEGEDNDYAETEEMLNEMSREGWELVTCAPVSEPRQDENPRQGHDNTVIAMHYYFRKKPSS